MTKADQINEMENHIKNLTETLRDMMKWGANEVTRDYSREIKECRERLKKMKAE